MWSLSNTLLNRSSIAVWCAYSAPDPKGGWDVWKVRSLGPGRKVSHIDVDYISPADDSCTINGRSGWWKLEQSGSFFICANMKSNGQDLLLSSTRGSVAKHYDEWAKGADPSWIDIVLGRGHDSQEDVDRQKAEWEQLKDPAGPFN